MEDPPATGAVQETVSVSVPAMFWSAVGIGELTDGSEGVPGTVVTVTAAEAAEAGPAPSELDATTVNVGVDEESNPVTVTGDEAPVPVSPVEAVTTNEVAAGELAGKENETVTAPSLKAREVPTLDPETPVGARGSKKSFELCEFAPRFFPIAMLTNLLSCFF
tara:strand:- start:5575 stop:6063 length:489 start_codon:yes stop_codon:yes gene_type:complete